MYRRCYYHYSDAAAPLYLRLGLCDMSAPLLRAPRYRLTTATRTHVVPCKQCGGWHHASTHTSPSGPLAPSAPPPVQHAPMPSAPPAPLQLSCRFTDQVHRQALIMHSGTAGWFYLPLCPSRHQQITQIIADIASVLQPGSSTSRRRNASSFLGCCARGTQYAPLDA